ncbi:MAG: DUF1579 family protein [Candidatus Eremiobacteraeota bacterium]|nr:DUF1579 family protein [Candidatus Eremiobacteraeota bacterium]
MIGSFRHGGAIAIAAFALIAISGAAATASPQQATVQSFVGTWNCVTHTSDNKTYHETDTDTMWANWLKIDGDMSVQGQPAVKSMGFFGYDPKQGRWYIASVDSMGNYASNYSTSKNLGGSTWHDGYPNNGGSATVSTSKNQYVVDSKGRDMHGKAVTSHEVCTRA